MSLLRVWSAIDRLNGRSSHLRRLWQLKQPLVARLFAASSYQSHSRGMQFPFEVSSNDQPLIVTSTQLVTKLLT